MTTPDQTVTTPEEAIQRLKDGNQRFTSGMRSVEPLLSHLKMRELATNGQKPFGIVLTCSDSRSPAEMIFDQGLGDLFVVRVAGNVVAPSLLASIEYAATNLGSKAILVLGHTLCGAIGATIAHVRHPEEPLPSSHLEELVARIQPAVYHVVKKTGLDDKTLPDLAVEANVRRSCRLIYEQSSIVRKLVEEHGITIQGAVLDIHTGNVRFLE